MLLRPYSNGISGVSRELNAISSRLTKIAADIENEPARLVSRFVDTVVEENLKDLRFSRR
jgi:hypothetical protein